MTLGTSPLAFRVYPASLTVSHQNWKKGALHMVRNQGRAPGPPLCLVFVSSTPSITWSLKVNGAYWTPICWRLILALEHWVCTLAESRVPELPYHVCSSPPHQWRLLLWRGIALVPCLSPSTQHSASTQDVCACVFQAVFIDWVNGQELDNLIVCFMISFAGS